MKLLDQLKADGYKVRIDHLRELDPDAAYLVPKSKGGVTEATIYDGETGHLLAMGTSHCSKRDNYNKSLGAQTALGRAYCVLTGEAHRRRAAKEN